MSGNKKDHFERIKKRLCAKLTGWMAKLLSVAGKGTLIRSVAQSIPIYSMSSVILPKGVVTGFDKMVRRI